MNTELTWPDLCTLLQADPAKTLQNWYFSGRLQEQLPELHALFGVPQPKEHHPEIDAGVHTLLVIKQACNLSDDVDVRFAALVHDLGKALTPSDEWPTHRTHEKQGLVPVTNLCDRLKVSGSARMLAMQVCEHHLKCHRALEMTPGNLIQWMNEQGFLGDKRSLLRFLVSCEADARGRTGFENREYLSSGYMLKVASIVAPLMADDSLTFQKQLQASINAVKRHYAPFSDVELRKSIIRTDDGNSDKYLALGHP
jgi:tRNA nucleotidyltransferase (CCA-adding enzyme)